jgi:hypothetical protein
MGSIELRIAALIVLLAVFASERTAQAQRGRVYQPSRPTISPYFGYFQPRNTAGLPNYFSVVRPTRQTQADFRFEQNRISNLERQIELRDSGEQRITVRQRLTRDVGQPARAATFLNYGQFFPPQPVTRRR